jgi:hypothetical protein
LRKLYTTSLQPLPRSSNEHSSDISHLTPLSLTRSARFQTIEQQYYASSNGTKYSARTLRSTSTQSVCTFQFVIYTNAANTILAYDEHNLTLYVNISQTFAIWFVPFHRSPVNLTTVLQLVRGENLNLQSPFRPPSSTPKYYITSQNDLYQVDQFVRFFAPWGVGTTVIAFWHWVATLFCIVGARVFGPLHWLFAELSRPVTGQLDGDRSHGRSQQERDTRNGGSDEAIERALQWEDGVKSGNARRRGDGERLSNGSD